MRKFILFLAGVCLLQTSLTAAGQAGAAGGAKPQAETAKPAAANADKKEVKVSEKVLQTYVGEYQLDETRSLTFALDKGSLWGGPAGQTPQQLYAESQTKFFLKTMPIQITFKTEKGKVTGLVMQREGRPDQEMKKVK